MTVIFGHNEAEARMKRETMTPNSKVSINHNYYSEEPEKKSKREKKREKHKKGDRVGDDEYAIGGVAKVRRHYPHT